MQPGEKQARQWTHEQKYVYFRLKESLAAGRWEPFRPPVIGLSSLVEETAAVVELYLAERGEEPSHILSELRDRLKSSALFDKSGYVRVRECLVTLIDKCMNAQKGSPDWKVLLSILRVVVAKMRPEVVITDALESLQEVLQEEPPKYCRIDDLVFTIADELPIMGFSHRYLKRWLDGHPFWETSFAGYLEAIRSLLKQETRQFSCRFIVQLPEQFRSEILQLYGVREQAPSRDSLSSGYAGPENIPAEPAGYVVLVQALDRFRAAEIARGRFQEAIRLISIQGGFSSIDLPSQVIIESPRDEAEAVEAVSRDRGQPVELKNLVRYLKASAPTPGPTYSAQTGRSIHGAVYWLQLARDAPQEMRIVNLWTALEVLTGSEQTRAIDAVTGAVRPFAVMYYIPLLIESLMSEFQRMMRKAEVPETVPEAAAAALGTTGRPDPSAFARFLLCEDLDTSLQRQDILLRKVRDFRSLFSHEHSLAERLVKYDKEVERDLRRAYRYRNWIVHRGISPTNTFNRITDRLIFYTRTLMNGILATLARYPSLGIHEAIEIKRQSCRQFIEQCKELKPGDAIDEIVNPRDILT